MTTHLLSLAAGTVLECSPAETVAAAAAAGFDASGVWVDLATWTPAVAAEVRTRLADTGMRALDAEVIRLAADRPLDNARRVVDIAAEVGAEYALTISLDPDLARTAAQYAELCAHGASVGVRPVLEFMRFTTVRTLADAVAVVTDAGHAAGAVLVDALHLDRSAGTPAEVAALDPTLLPYAQLCDAPAIRPAADGLIDEALNGRLLPGDGDLPLDALIDAFAPATPFSMELRSAALRDDYPDAVERAAVVLTASRAMLGAT